MSIWTQIVKKVFLWSCNWLYNHIDKNDDGKISKAELKDFYNEINLLLKKVKKHS